MGVVYRAYDERLARTVAIKLIRPGLEGDPRLTERLRREARANAQLSHPAIVRIYDLFEAEDSVAIIMELVEGQPLEKWLHGRPADLVRGLVLARQIAEAIAAAHTRGIVHRDLKAENVLITPEGNAKVLDFGIARWLPCGESSLTAEGAIIGTCRSMSPEQAEGREVGPRSDLFSLGILLYELFTGQSPFLAHTPAATLRRVCDHRQQPAHEVLSCVPRELSLLIERLLQKDPALRPTNAQEVALALHRIARATPGVTEPDGATEDLKPTVHEPSAALLKAEPTPSAGLGGSGERRQVTVLRCSLCHPAGEPLDPEELLAAMPEAHAAVFEAVRRFEGRLSTQRGHGWLATFGDLQAHEDDALRAVFAGVEIAAQARKIRLGTGMPLTVRIGVHTGSMVVTRGSFGGEDVLLGETPNVAVLVENLAPPGSVAVSQTTYRLAQGALAGEELTPLTLSGSQQLRTYRVVEAAAARPRVEASHASTPLVAREQEIRLLLERWAMARTGTGQVALVSGEAGMGKSRLVSEFRQRISGEVMICLEGHGSPFARDSAFHPVIEGLEQLIGADRKDSAEVRLSRLESTLTRYDLSQAEALPLLAPLFALPAGAQGNSPALSPDMQRRKTLETVVRPMLAAAEHQPLLLLIEDVHWIDPSTFELLGLLVEYLATAPILLLLTTRPESSLSWAERSYFSKINLAPLTVTQAAFLVTHLCKRMPLDEDTCQQIATRTDGVPLFIEELTKTILESGARARTEMVPGSLEGWFLARLDRLGPAREVVQLASILGREFSADLLHAVSPWPSADLLRNLDILVEAEILYRRGLPPRQSYIFKHALLQDAAYASLLRGNRQRLHGHIADILEERFPWISEARPETIAHHYTEASRPDKAIPLWHRAGGLALQTAALQEALRHLTRAMDLLPELPEGPDRDRQELPLQVSLGVAEGQIRGYSAPKVRQAYTRAHELCSRMRHSPHIFTVLQGLYIFYAMCAETRRVLEVSEEMLALSAKSNDPLLFLTSNKSMGFSHMCMGQLNEARAFLEKALEVYSPEQSFAEAAVPGTGNPATACLFNLSWTLWFLGYPDQAHRRGEESIAQARRNAHPHIMLAAMQSDGNLFALLRKPEDVLCIGEEILSVGAKYGIWIAQPTGEILKGWALATTGRCEEGLALMRRSLEVRLAAGTRFVLPVHFALLADACVRLGRTEEGLSAVEKGLSVAETFGSLMNAELYRLRGELLREQGGADEEAEELFLQALNLAQAQSAKSLELRAAMSLSRFRVAQGRGAEARSFLSSVYGWFTEGFSSGDLMEAGSLLQELGSSG
jgi:class 3 adenylate cyclase/predicted ATPase